MSWNKKGKAVAVSSSDVDSSLLFGRQPVDLDTKKLKRILALFNKRTTPREQKIGLLSKARNLVAESLTDHQIDTITELLDNDLVLARDEI